MITPSGNGRLQSSAGRRKGTNSGVSNSGAQMGGGGEGKRIIHSDDPRHCPDSCSVENGL